jgi:hypothetical protein
MQEIGLNQVQRPSQELQLYLQGRALSPLSLHATGSH